MSIYLGEIPLQIGGSGWVEPIEYTMTTNASTGEKIINAINNYIGDNNGYFAILKDVNESMKTAYHCVYLTVQPERINALSNNTDKYSFARLNNTLTRVEIISSSNYACRASIGDTFVIYPIS